MFNNLWIKSNNKKLILLVCKHGLSWKSLSKYFNYPINELKNSEELNDLISEFADEPMKNICITGLMGMASFSDDMNKVRNEFRELKKLFDRHSEVKTQNQQISTLSMGMSSDYITAIEEGSTMVRIGSLLFGERIKK